MTQKFLVTVKLSEPPEVVKVASLLEAQKVAEFCRCPWLIIQCDDGIGEIVDKSPYAHYWIRYSGEDLSMAKEIASFTKGGVVLALTTGEFVTTSVSPH